MKSLSMVSKDNSAINFSQCRILSVIHQSPIVTHRHSPSLTVTYRTHRHACYCDFAAAFGSARGCDDFSVFCISNPNPSRSLVRVM